MNAEISDAVKSKVVKDIEELIAQIKTIVAEMKGEDQ